MPLHGLEAIWRDNTVVGFLRRGDYGFTIGKSIGYGYVSRPDGEAVTNDYLQSGNYFLEHMGKVVPAKLHLRSPVRSK